MIPVGLQLYSLRELAAADLAGTLEKIRNMGYTGIEFAGLYGQRHIPQGGCGAVLVGKIHVRT